MTKTLPALAAIAALLLAGCAGGESEEFPSTATDGGYGEAADLEALATVTWDTGIDGQPALEFDTPLTLTGTAALRIEEGDGAALEQGQQLMLEYVMVGGADGAVQYSTYDFETQEALELAEDLMFPELFQALSDASVGERLLLGVAQDAGDGSDPVVTLMAMTVADAIDVPDRAEGEAVDPVAGLPAVTLDDAGAPSVEIPAEEPPSELVSQELIVGEGATVEEDQSVTVHYTGWLWDDGTQFDSSWEAGTAATFTLTSGMLIDGWVDGLVGHTVGSQVLLVVPPDSGYGENGSGVIPGGATLVFVVDILAAT